MSEGEQKWMMLSALGRIANAAKDTDAGHRVYLRCMTLIEIELGIENKKNYEVSEGYLHSIEELYRDAMAAANEIVSEETEDE